jgi:hypothetical protein
MPLDSAKRKISVRGVAGIFLGLVPDGANDK